MTVPYDGEYLRDPRTHRYAGMSDGGLEPFCACGGPWNLYHGHCLRDPACDDDGCREWRRDVMRPAESNADATEPSGGYTATPETAETISGPPVDLARHDRGHLYEGEMAAIFDPPVLPDVPIANIKRVCDHGDELDRLREAVGRVRELCDRVEAAADEYARTEGIHTDGAVDVDAIRRALGEEA